MNEGKVFTEVTDEGRAFQTVGAARLKALSARIVVEEGTASSARIQKLHSSLAHFAVIV